MARTRPHATVVLLMLLLALGAAAAGPTTLWVTRTIDGRPPHAWAAAWGGPSISSDGRWTTFAAYADNLSPGVDRMIHIYVRDRITGGVELISQSSDGVPGNHYSLRSRITANGRYVIFESLATNLVPGDANARLDIFIRDRNLRLTQRLSVATGGAEAAGTSHSLDATPDGRYVIFMSDAPNLVAGDTNAVQDVFIRDRGKGVTERISVATNGAQGDRFSGFVGGSITPDGRYVAFNSSASTLVPGDDPNAEGRVIIRDRLLKTTVRLVVHNGVSPGEGASYNPSITADGRFVLFRHDDYEGGWPAPRMTTLLLRDRSTGATEQIVGPVARTGALAEYSDLPRISPDGRYLTFSSDSATLVPGDTNGVKDVFVHDRLRRTMERVSVSSAGTQADHDAVPLQEITPDGRFVLYSSAAATLVPGDSNGVVDQFVRDRQAGITERVSLAADGSQWEIGGSSPLARVSADGRFVAFISDAVNLVAGDTNLCSDIFVFDRTTGAVERASVTSTGLQVNGASEGRPAMSPDGRFVAFLSHASNLVNGDSNGQPDVFLRDRLLKTTERISVASGSLSDPADSGMWAPAVSADGKYVAYFSTAPHPACDPAAVPRLYLRNRGTGVTESLWKASSSAQGHPNVELSTDGRHIATASASGIYLYDRAAGRGSMISRGPGGVAANGPSWNCSLSADGRYAAFSSLASNLVAGDTNRSEDVFVYDRSLQTVERVSLANSGGQAVSGGAKPSISGDGAMVSFASTSNLAIGDTNGAWDLFVRDRIRRTTTRLNLSAGGSPAPLVPGTGGALSRDGRFGTFESTGAVAPGSASYPTGSLFLRDRGSP